MTRVVRAALTETKNVYPLPDRVEDLDAVRGNLDDIRAANVAHHVDLARKAHALGARVVCFGEVFPAPYFAIAHTPFFRDMAEPLDGPTVTTLRALAKELALVVVAPIYERVPATDERFNTAVVIDADGEVCGFYSKTHIPHGGNEKNQFVEGFYFSRSTGRANTGARNVSQNRFFPVFTTSIGKVGVAICYDRHFEGVVSALAHEGAELVFCPAVTFGAKSERMWEMEFAVDAMRHRVFIGGSNRKGSEPPWNQPYFGGSHFVGPDGRCANLARDERLVVADLDLGALSSSDTSGWKLLNDARPEIYRR